MVSRHAVFVKAMTTVATFRPALEHICMAHHNTPDDAALVAQILAGDHTAFEPLLRRHTPSVERLCRRLLGSAFEAEDVAQEAALQAFLGLRQLHDPARFGPWLHAIAANLARKALRKRRPLSLDALLDTAGDAFLHDGAGPEERALARETRDHIAAALDNLGNASRIVIVGYYLAEQSYAELADRLGLPLSTVKSRLFKGRRALRHALAPLAPRRPAHKKETAMTAASLAPLEVATVRVYPITQRCIVLLRDAADVHLPLRLRADEADPLVDAMLRRPVTAAAPDLLLQSLAALGGQLSQVEVRRLADQTFYAALHIQRDGASHTLDARLSDGLALALKTDVALVVSADLLRDAGFTLVLPEEIATPQQPDASPPRLPKEEPTVEEREPKRPRGLAEQIWLLLLNFASDERSPANPLDLEASLWAERFPAEPLNWQGQPMVAVQLPADQPAALLVRPQLWERIEEFVASLQQHDLARFQPPPPPTIAPEERERLTAALQTLLADIADAGYRTVAFHHLGGLLVAWASRDDEGEVLRNALANLRERQFEQQYAALVGSADHAVYVYSRRSDQAMRGLIEGNFGWINLIDGPWMLQVVEDAHADLVTPERQRVANGPDARLVRRDAGHREYGAVETQYAVETQDFASLSSAFVRARPRPIKRFALLRTAAP